MEISTAGATRHPEAGRQQIALDERGRDASPDLCSESPIHSTSEDVNLVPVGPVKGTTSG